MNSNDLALLQLLVTHGVGPRTVDRVLSSALAQGKEIGGPEATRVADWQRLGLKPSLAQAVAEAREEADQLRELLEAHDIFLLAKGTPEYPRRLKRPVVRDATPLLFGQGDRLILDRPAVAFCGSRRASEQGLNWTRDFAAALAREGVNIVSGYANGIDLAAHRAALEAGGTTTLVLAEGILRFTLKPELADSFAPDRSLILSEFSPRLPWSVGNAMQRNGTILGLADAIIVVESGLEGGTFAAAEKARAESRPLFVLDDPAPPPSAAGNRYLLDHEARPLRVERANGANLEQILRLIRGEIVEAPAETAESRSPAIQRSLFDL